MEGINKIRPEIKYGILSSLIATIFFLYFLEPTLNLLGNLFLKMSAFVSNKFIDRLYAEIAVGKTDYSFIWIMLVLTVSAFTVSVILFRPEINAQKDKIKNRQQSKSKRERAGVSFILKLLIVMAFWISFSAIEVMSNIKIQTVDAFEQHIKILTPYITPEAKNKLVSDFASMNTLDDYKKIYKQIDSFAQASGIKLPEKKIAFY
jgi:hypothetical protein